MASAHATASGSLQTVPWRHCGDRLNLTAFVSDKTCVSNGPFLSCPLVSRNHQLPLAVPLCASPLLSAVPPLQARIEGNPQNMAQFRVTVASPAPQLSAQVKELLCTHLKTMAAT